MSEWENGLPGVGVECDIEFIGGNTYRKAEITYIGDGVGCYRHDDHELTFARTSVIFHPIKKREPKPGEVWLCGSLQVPCVMSNTGDLYPFPLVELNGSNSFPIDASGLEYAAPSVKAYIAREILERHNAGESGIGVLAEYARLDEE